MPCLPRQPTLLGALHTTDQLVANFIGLVVDDPRYVTHCFRYNLYRMSNLLTQATRRGAGPSMPGATPNAGASTGLSFTSGTPLSRDEFVSALSQLAVGLPKPERVSTVAYVCKLDLQLGLELAVALNVKSKDVASILRRSDVREFQQQGIETLKYLIERTLACKGTTYCSSRRTAKNFLKAINGESLPAEPIPDVVKPLLEVYFSPRLKEKGLEAPPKRSDTYPRIVTDSLRLAAQLLDAQNASSPVEHDKQPQDVASDLQGDDTHQASQERLARLRELQALQADYRQQLQAILSTPHNLIEPVVIALPHPVSSQEEMEVLSSVWAEQAVVQTADWRMHVSLKTGESRTESTAEYPTEIDLNSGAVFPDISRSAEGKVVLTSAINRMEFEGSAKPVFISGSGALSNIIQISSGDSLRFISVDPEGALYTAAEFHLDTSSKTLFIKVGDHEGIQIHDVQRLPSIQTDGTHWAAQVGVAGAIFTFYNGSHRVIHSLGTSAHIWLCSKGLLLERSHELESAILHDLTTGHSQRIHCSEFHEPSHIYRFRDGYISSHWGAVREANLHLLFHAPIDKGDQKVSGSPFLEQVWRDQTLPFSPNVSTSGDMLEFSLSTLPARKTYVYDGARVTEIATAEWIYNGCELDGIFYFVVKQGSTISLHAALPEGVVVVDTLPQSISAQATNVEVKWSGSRDARCHFITLKGPDPSTFRIDRDGFIALGEHERISGGHIISFESAGTGPITHLSVLPAKSAAPFSRAELALIQELQAFFQTNDPASLSPESRRKIAMTQPSIHQLSPMHAHVLTQALRARPETFVGHIPVDAHSFSLNRAVSEALIAALVPSFSQLLAARERYQNRFSGTMQRPQASDVFEGLGDDPDTARSVILGTLDTEYDGFLATCELGQIQNTKVVRCTLPKTKQGKSTHEKIKAIFDVEQFSYCESVSLPAPLQARVQTSRAVSQRRIDTPGALTVDVSNTPRKKLSYSFRPEITSRLVPPSQEQYDAFVESLEPSVRSTLTTTSLTLPGVAQSFLRQISHHPPVTRALMIRDWIVEHGQYEKGYYEFRSSRATMSLSEKLRFMMIRASMLNHPGRNHTRKLFSGVCAEYALLALAMYRSSGIVATVATGYMVSGTEINSKHAHALNVIYFPDANGSVRKFELDATPSSSSHDTYPQAQKTVLDMLRREVEQSSNATTPSQAVTEPTPASLINASDNLGEIDALPEMTHRPGSEIQRILRILEYIPPLDHESADALLAIFKEQYFPISEGVLETSLDEEDIRTGVSRISRRRFWQSGREQAIADAQHLIQQAIQYARKLAEQSNLLTGEICQEPSEQ